MNADTPLPRSLSPTPTAPGSARIFPFALAAVLLTHAALFAIIGLPIPHTPPQPAPLQMVFEHTPVPKPVTPPPDLPPPEATPDAPNTPTETGTLPATPTFAHLPTHAPKPTHTPAPQTKPQPTPVATPPSTAPASQAQPPGCIAPTPPYPNSARVLHESGSATLTLTVAPGGRILHTALTTSTGHDDLDDAATSTAQTLTCRNPTPTNITLTLPIHFRLH